MPLLLLSFRAEAAVKGDVERVEGGLLGREVTAGLHRLPELGVYRLDGVRGADDGAYLVVETAGTVRILPTRSPGA
jgi:hypothetical protein